VLTFYNIIKSDPGSGKKGFRIPDQGVKKGPEPDSDLQHGIPVTVRYGTVPVLHLIPV
jgi:hypothetical protein